MEALDAADALAANDPNDANVSSSAAFQQGWLQHLTSRWGTAANTGVRYYMLDNEPDLWSSTHSEIHPNGATYAELVQRCTDFASGIKAVLIAMTGSVTVLPAVVR